MKRYLLFFVFLAFQYLQAQEVLTFDLIESYTASEIAALGVPDAEYDVDLYTMTYTTIGTDGMPDTASGSVALPILDMNDDPAPFLIYHHGTVNDRFDVPSQGSGESQVGLTAATLGYVGLLPDYLGMGTSRGYHPYLHVETQARSAIDQMLAMSGELDDRSFSYEKKVFLTGYSQGGHAGASTHFVMEQNPLPDYELVACSHLSGPYDLNGVTFENVLSDDVYLFVAYIPHVLLGMQEAYGNLFNEVEEIFKPQYATIIERLYDDEPLFDINQELIGRLILDNGLPVPKAMLQDSILAQLETNPNHRIRQALEDNTLTDWAPVTPTRLVYCEADEQVNFRNAQVADSIMNELGAADLESLNIDPDANHGGCVEPALNYTIDFFAGFRETSNEEQELVSFDYRLQNVNGGIRVMTEEVFSGSIQIFNLQGQRIAENKATQTRSVTLPVSVSGMYVVELRSEMGTSSKLHFYN
ncbi:MAG TPA: lipase family protein [Saprospiraceae bacterium]|nr:lipase family protein [Saprospiraceae bacterium]